jgi:hypothetical protein
MRLSNRVVIKLFSPDNKKLLRRLIIKAPGGFTFTPDGVQVQLNQFKTKLDELIPNHKYKCLVHSKEEFSFYWDSNFKLTPEELAEFYTEFAALEAEDPALQFKPKDSEETPNGEPEHTEPGQV